MVEEAMPFIIIIINLFVFFVFRFYFCELSREWGCLSFSRLADGIGYEGILRGRCLVPDCACRVFCLPFEAYTDVCPDKERRWSE
jgi:hypothetical protein